MTEQYGANMTERLIASNAAADKLADEGAKMPNQTTTRFNKYQNPFVLCTTRKRNVDLVQDPVINTCVRATLKKHLLQQATTKLLHKPKYESYTEHKYDISKLSYNLMKSQNHTHEPFKKHMSRILHNTLPVCSKCTDWYNRKNLCQ